MRGERHREVGEKGTGARLTCGLGVARGVSERGVGEGGAVRLGRTVVMVWAGFRSVRFRRFGSS